MSSTEKSVVVEAPIGQVYEEWTHFDRFPSFMDNIESVAYTGPKATHWKAKVGGITKEWDAETTQMVPDQLIAWRSTDGSENSGEIRFLPAGTGTEVQVRMDYDPGNLLLKAADALTGQGGRGVQGGLDNFKEQVEQPATAR